MNFKSCSSFSSSKSLLANVLDIDDDFRCNHSCPTFLQQPTYYRTVYRYLKQEKKIRKQKVKFIIYLISWVKWSLLFSFVFEIYLILFSARFSSVLSSSTNTYFIIVFAAASYFGSTFPFEFVEVSRTKALEQLLIRE